MTEQAVARAWLRVYAGYDDAALAALANPGLLRRARKELAGGTVAVAEETGDEVVLTVGAARVRLDARGPAAVTCGCPTAGVCQHVVTACLWARDAAEPAGGPGDPADARDDQPENRDDDRRDVRRDDAPRAGDGAVGPDPLAELVALDPAAVHRSVGAAAVRAVAARWDAPAAEAACVVRVDGPRAVVSWPGSPEVTYVAGAGVAGMVVGQDRAPHESVPGAADGTGAGSGASRARGTGSARGTGGAAPARADAELRLEAVARAVVHRGGAWPFPVTGAGAPGAVPDDARAAHAEAREVVERVLDAGLSHLGANDVEALRAAAVRARLARRPALHRLLTTCAGVVEDLVERADDVDEQAALEACAEAWAFASVPPSATTAHDAQDEEPAALDVPRLVPLGARWWQASSGSRGVTLVAWDAGTLRVRTVTTGRPAGVDPTFRRSWDLPLVWGRSLGRLAAGPFAVAGAPSRPGGALGAGGSPVVSGLGPFDVDELRDVADRTARPAAPHEAVGFDRSGARTRLVMLRETGDVGVDEVRQTVTWRVTEADGTSRTLRVPVADGHAVDAVLALAARRVRVVAVTVETRPGARDDEPVGFFVHGTGGRLDLVSPTLTPVAREVRSAAGWRRLRSRVDALRAGAAAHAAPTPPPTPVERVCDVLAGVALALAATGRRRLTPRQTEEVRTAGRLARDLGLATLDRVAHDLAGDLDAPTVLRAAFLAGRARAVAHQLDGPT